MSSDKVSDQRLKSFHGGLRAPRDRTLLLDKCRLRKTPKAICVSHEEPVQVDHQAEVDATWRLEAIGRHACGIAHDFSNLLAVVKSNIDLLKLYPSSERAPRWIAAALTAVSIGSSVSQQLMRFARDRKDSSAACDLNAIIMEVYHVLRHTVGESILLKLELSADLPFIMSNPAEIKTTLLNLTSNARYAMNSNGELVIATSTVVLDATAADELHVEAGIYVRMQLKDNGAGMSDDVLAHAFEPFFTTKEDGRGTGLGLFIVRDFVTRSGGQVTLESAGGHGTTATIYFRVQDSQVIDFPAVADSDDLFHAEDQAKTAVELLVHGVSVGLGRF